MTLPEKFLSNMKELLGEEFPDYIDSMERPSRTALRVNTGKLSPEQFRAISPFALEEVPWTAKGFYYDGEKDNPAKHPHYYAGLYYIQEPSAMIPASILPVEPGDKILDLCAAPGGKATELAARLEGTGLLVANDISVSRGMALAKNLQIAGVRNAVVTAETPEHLADRLGRYFDKILIDAPCSGEGMFRRDPHMVRDWLEHGPEYYVPMQRQILEKAWEMLKPGGYMVYSTCTFSVQEDEAMVQWFLDHYPDMQICPVERKPGFSYGMPDMVPGGSKALEECVRIFPHRAEGEGHFAVLLQKKGTDYGLDGMGSGKGSGIESGLRSGIGFGMGSPTRGTVDDSSVSKMGQTEEFLMDVAGLGGCLREKKGQITLITAEMQKLSGLRILSCGLILGEQKKNRFEPATQLALAIRKEDYPHVVDVSSDDMEGIKYLKGETLMTTSSQKGWLLFCVDGFPVGWCKGTGQGTLKNKYYPGWRMQ